MHNEEPTIQLPSGPVIELRYVQGGKFMMGDDKSEYGDEKPAHPVRLSDFYLGKFPVTQEVWQAVMNNNPSSFKGEHRPVETVSWEDAQEFLARLNQQTGRVFRLPTEAEWEYAAQGGRHSEGYIYAGSDRLKQVGWYEKNSGDETHEVGLLYDNELGLYDMSGNVWEWCQDWFSKEYYVACHQQGTVDNPQGPDTGSYRVLRGGGWIYYPVGCRSIYRSSNPPVYRHHHIGFRLALPSQSAGS
ncbi:MAG: formylglycine-generating enzyme family protein [Candidatus Electrothrix sp. GW3-4]|uniref:formylglycine-generating enzyme family protein n=1 Tax=Candidatus Electrothrix sp. GW3-4 TaxID=3126740 RepID=UPI0030CA9F65